MTGVYGDPHFSIILHDGKKLCYTIQGRDYSVFNLVTCNDYLINAKFIPDSKRVDVTWIGSLGIVVDKSLRYGGAKVNSFKFDADTRTIHIGNEITLDAKTIEEITSENGTISIIETSSAPQRLAVKVALREIGLHFTVNFVDGHLDMMWHNPIQGSHAHGLIGKQVQKLHINVLDTGKNECVYTYVCLYQNVINKIWRLPAMRCE